MIETYKTKRFLEYHAATVFDTHQTDIEFDGIQIKMNIWDTSGMSGMENLRKLIYQDTDVFVICFDLKNASWVHDWMNEVRQRRENKAPIILVGTKSDLRSKVGRRNKYVTYKQGVHLAKDIGAVKYLECSSKNNEGLEATFQVAAKVGLGWGYKK